MNGIILAISAFIWDFFNFAEYKKPTRKRENPPLGDFEKSLKGSTFREPTKCAFSGGR